MELSKKEQMVVDQINTKIDNRIEEKTNLYQKQLDTIFTRLEEGMAGKKGVNTFERKEAREWLTKFFKRQQVDQMEQKEAGFSNYMATDPDASGGYLVPSILSSEIAHYVQESGAARQRMRYMPFSGPGNKRQIPKELSGVAVSWVDEAGKKPLTTLTLTKIDHELKKLAAIAVLTEDLVEDSSFDILDYTARRIGEAIAREEDRVYFSGDIGSGDPFDGVINATGIVPVTMAAGQGVADITADHLLTAIYAIPKEARSGSAFYLNSDVLFRLQLLKDNENRYLVSRPMADSEPARIWGYPIYAVDVLPGLEDNDVDMPFAIFANLQRTCVYGDKMGLRVKMLDQATLTDAQGNSMNLAENDALAVRVHKRSGFACLHPEGIAVLTTGEAT